MENNAQKNNIENELPPSWEVSCAEDATAAIILLSSTANAVLFNEIMAKYGIILAQEEIPEADLENLYDYSNMVFTASLGDMLEKKQGQHFSSMMYYLKKTAAGVPEGVLISKPNLEEKNYKLVNALSGALKGSLAEIKADFIAEQEKLEQQQNEEFSFEEGNL